MRIRAGRVCAPADRHAIQTYLTDETLDQLVDKCLRAKAEHDIEVDLASPLLPIPHAARIIAGLAMAITVPPPAPTTTTPTTAIREASDTLTNIALALSHAADTGHALIEPATAVAARTELTRFADHLADRTWTVPDDDAGDHPDDPDHAAEPRQRLHDAVRHDISYLQ